MRRTASIALTLLALGAVASCTASSEGPNGSDTHFGMDSGLEFDATADASDDSATSDDATVEAAPEAASHDEAAVDSANDATSPDASMDGAEASMEAGMEASLEASVEAGPEAGPDAAPDAARPMCVNPATDCPATGTLCKVAICSSGVCAVQNAPAGTACSDGGGNICASLGYCESSCLDGVKDATETDVDCGGAYCDAAFRTCADGKHCGTGADCFDKVCTGGICQAATCSDGVQNGGETGVDCGGPCTALAVPQACPSGDGCTTATDCLSGECNSSYVCIQRPNGQQCWNGAQSCASGFCAPVTNGLGSVCCSAACTGTCEYCGGGPGLVNGTCGLVAAGNSAPNGECAISGECGNDGNCTAAGTCEQRPTTTNCGPICTGITLTSPGFCDGMGGCGGVQSSCSPYACSTFVPACNTSCSGPSDCAPGHTCNGSTCM